MNCGYYPGKNLIITAETSQTQLNADIISQCIKYTASEFLILLRDFLVDDCHGEIHNHCPKISP